MTLVVNMDVEIEESELEQHIEARPELVVAYFAKAFEKMNCFERDVLWEKLTAEAKRLGVRGA